MDKLIKEVQTNRKLLNMSLRELAKVTGVSFSTLARLERGIGKPSQHVCTVLIEWLETPDKQAFEPKPRGVSEITKLKRRLEALEESVANLSARTRGLIRFK